MVLVTGANGFIGQALCHSLIHHQIAIRGVVRRLSNESPFPCVTVQDIGGDVDWGSVLAGVDAVVHLAARVHVMAEQASDPLAEYRRINTYATEKLAYAAAARGVRRFVYLSTIKVNGEETAPGKPFTADTLPHPIDPYGISKYEAELALQRCAVETGMEVVIIRPVLVYGPGVGGNFQMMMHWVQKGIPLPFGAVNNKRSLVSIDNLVSLIMTVLDHPCAANQVFLVSDGADVSTAELVKALASASHAPERLFAAPPALLTGLLSLLGKQEISKRLLGSLQVDMTKTQTLLGWSPPVPPTHTLSAMFATHLFSAPHPAA